MTRRSLERRLATLEAQADEAPLDLSRLDVEEWREIVCAGIYDPPRGGLWRLGPGRGNNGLCEIWTTAEPHLWQPVADRINDEWFEHGFPVARLLLTDDECAVLCDLLDRGLLIVEPNYRPHTPSDGSAGRDADALVSRMDFVLAVEWGQRGLRLTHTQEGLRQWLTESALNA